MGRVLLLLPTATYRAPDFLAAAEALDAEVVVASDRQQALAGVMGDRAVRLDLRRPAEAADELVAHAHRSPVDAIVAVDDQGVVVAALAAARLGLPHNPPEAVAATRDKAQLRRIWEESGISQPDFAVAGPDADVAALVEQVAPPCVVKPVSLSASRGVIRADDPAEGVAAAARIRAILTEEGQEGAPLLVESYVPGEEVAVEGLLRGGHLSTLAVFDKPDPLEGPYFEETLFVTPSRLDPVTQKTVLAAVEDAAAAVGLVEGPVHAEVRVGEDGVVWLLELAARSIGGLCARTLRFGAGISLEEVILRHALGLPLEDLSRAETASGVMMLPIPRAGRLVEVRGQDAATLLPGVVGLDISVNPGSEVRPLPEGNRYLGFLFARGDTPERVEETLRIAHRHLEVVIADEAIEGTACPR